MVLSIYEFLFIAFSSIGAWKEVTMKLSYKYHKTDKGFIISIDVTCACSLYYPNQSSWATSASVTLASIVIVTAPKSGQTKLSELQLKAKQLRFQKKFHSTNGQFPKA